MREISRRTKFIILLIFFTAVIHLLQVWSYLPGNISTLYRSYFSDVLLPFTFYFILSIAKNLNISKNPLSLFIIVFGFCTIIEILQKYGIHILGTTYDPMDIVMYFMGSGIGLFVDVIIFRRKINGHTAY